MDEHVRESLQGLAVRLAPDPVDENDAEIGRRLLAMVDVGHAAIIRREQRE
jgi:hypothetical protein